MHISLSNLTTRREQTGCSVSAGSRLNLAGLSQELFRSRVNERCFQDPAVFQHEMRGKYIQDLLHNWSIVKCFCAKKRNIPDTLLLWNTPVFLLVLLALAPHLSSSRSFLCAKNLYQKTIIIQRPSNYDILLERQKGRENKQEKKEYLCISLGRFSRKFYWCLRV